MREKTISCDGSMKIKILFYVSNELHDYGLLCLTSGYFYQTSNERFNMFKTEIYEKRSLLYPIFVQPVTLMVHSDFITVHWKMSADVTCSLSQQVCMLQIFVRI